jgi:hypothetical protein
MHPNNKDRDIKKDVSTRARSKRTYPDQNVGATNRSKMQDTFNSSAEGLLFPLHEISHIRNSNTNTRDDSNLGTNERKMYHEVLMKIKFHVDFDHL